MEKVHRKRCLALAKGCRPDPEVGSQPGAWKSVSGEHAAPKLQETFRRTLRFIKCFRTGDGPDAESHGLKVLGQKKRHLLKHRGLLRRDRCGLRTARYTCRVRSCHFRQDHLVLAGCSHLSRSQWLAHENARVQASRVFAPAQQSMGQMSCARSTLPLLCAKPAD